MVVSILVPLYNEEEFVGELLSRVLRAPLPSGISTEVIVVDDCSTDESAAVVYNFIDKHPGKIRFIRHEVNQGKGAAVRTAIEHARGDIAGQDGVDTVFGLDRHSLIRQRERAGPWEG